jgi:hypothetical protein
MAHGQYLRHYESVSRDPATLGDPIVAIIYTADSQGPYEVRLPRKPGWESGVEAAIKADWQQRTKLAKIAFEV